jgi:ferrochelatase
MTDQQDKKTAVILFNLGGPDSKEAIEPFLFNFFMDPNIVGLPKPFRYLLAKRISKKRSKEEAGQSYGELGDRSPLLDNTKAQAQALEKALGKGFKVFVCMRYWHPMAPQIVQDVEAFAPDKIVLLPLYPQFSTTTTWSSLGVWKQAAAEGGLKTETALLCCYPENEGFAEAAADHIADRYEEAAKDGHSAPRILFSAHGLPEKIIKSGDPYQFQCEKTAEKIVEILKKRGITNFDWQICYQSRVGRLKWIGPSLDEALEAAAKDKKAVIVFPHAFTQEHVETLVELDIEYRHVAEKLGLPGYYRASCASDHPAFINALAALVRDYTQKTGIHAEGGTCLCPDHFSRCCMRASQKV